MKAIRTVALCLIGALLGPARVMAEPLPLATLDYPPYSIADINSPLRGFDAEVVKAVFATQGQEVRLLFYPWKRAVYAAEKGDVAAVFSCGEGQKSKFLLSDPISRITDAFIVNAHYAGPELRTHADARQLRIISTSGYTIADPLRALKIPFFEANSDEQAFDIFFSRDFETYLVTRESFEFMARQKQRRDYQVFELSSRQFHVCFSKAWPDAEALRTAFNKGLQQIHDNGLYDRTHAKYR